MKKLNIQQRRIRQGLCRCGEQPLPGKKACGPCAEQARVWARALQKKRRQRAQDAGLCLCGNKPVPGLKRCKKCRAKNKVQNKKRYRKNREAGLCGCGHPIDVSGKFNCSSCLKKQVNWQSRQFKRRAEEGRCRRCGKKPLPGKSCCKPCLAYFAMKGRERFKRVKAEVCAHYGSRCSCCGETRIEFLTIDHLNNDGRKHRAERGTVCMYTWLRKHNYPEGYDVKCWNCNVSRAHYGMCPHRRERETLKTESETNNS